MEKKKINYTENLKEYFNLIKKYKFLILLLFVVVIITESFLIADKFLYKWAINEAENYLSGSITSQNLIHILILISILFATAILLKSFGKYFESKLLTVLDPKVMKDLKEKYFNHILGLSHKFHTTHRTGKLISRLNRGSGAIEMMNDVLIFQIAPLILQLLMVSFSIFLFSKKTALIVFGITALFIVYSVILQKIQNKHKLNFNRASDKESGFISDILGNIETIKYFGKEKRIEKAFSEVTENVKQKSQKYWKYYAYLGFGQTLIVGLGTIALLYFPFKEFLAGQIELSTIIFIYALYGNIAGSIYSFVWGIRNYYRAMADMQDLFEYKKIKNEIKDKPNAKKLKIKKGEIEFKNVDFFYDKKQVLKNLNLKIKPNEKVAFVGHSGSGKTTIVKLINRLYDVENGSILIDGTDIREFKQESVREETGIVPQECILFDDTIYNNILFSNPKAKKEEVFNAIKLAQLDKLIEKLPYKEHTIVGERGIKLSGGEKQRISIARAILANKKILVLDEATSALDSQTEHEIQHALEKLLKNRTSIIIAHRLSTIMNADRIIVFKEGKIIEEGKHENLIKKNGEYSTLWNLQKGGYLD